MEQGGFLSNGLTALARLGWNLAWTFFAFRALQTLAPRLDYLKSFKGFGVEAGFYRNLESAATIQGVSINLYQSDVVWRRITRAAKEIGGMRILWVDDNPENNYAESRILRKFKVKIKQVRNTQDAIDHLNRRDFDVIISDMKRGENTAAGLELRDFVGSITDIPFIIYTGDSQETRERPARLFGITNRPDELIHLIIDARARQVG